MGDVLVCVYTLHIFEEMYSQYQILTSHFLRRGHVHKILNNELKCNYRFTIGKTVVGMESFVISELYVTNMVDCTDVSGSEPFHYYGIRGDRSELRTLEIPRNPSNSATKKLMICLYCRVF